eukprot:SAG31_NODE_30334_length_382_cov_1.176678_2_plen_53_part_01
MLLVVALLSGGEAKAAVAGAMARRKTQGRVVAHLCAAFHTPHARPPRGQVQVL